VCQQACCIFCQTLIFFHISSADVSSEVFYMSYQQQTWTTPAGVVERRNYNDGEIMSGIIAPTGAFSIRLQFNFFSTESCCDFVTVKSCTAIDCLQSRVLGTYSGSKDSFQVTSDTGVVLIQWSTDSSVVSSGWSATWTSVTGGKIFNGFVRGGSG
jgi:hypothetical protein